MRIAILLLLGAAGGFFSSLIGIGGGILIIPSLVLLLGFSQKLAQGTTLAMLLPPIGIAAVWTYYRQGWVDFPAAALLCVGFLIGSAVGAGYVVGIEEVVLRKGFGLLLIVLGIKMLF